MPAAMHEHSFHEGSDPTGIPLVLLHGSDGTETDLMPLAGELAPGSPKLGIRGSVPTAGGHAFFRRFPDRSIDEADIAARIPALATFIETASASHHVTAQPVAVGYSNGAIMAAALLLARPSLLAAAILLRPLLPFSQNSLIGWTAPPVLIIDGENDKRRSAGDGLRLAEQLQGSGALVTHHVLPVGHSITQRDKDIARAWLHPLLSRD